MAARSGNLTLTPLRCSASPEPRLNKPPYSNAARRPSWHRRCVPVSSITPPHPSAALTDGAPPGRFLSTRRRTCASVHLRFIQTVHFDDDFARRADAPVHRQRQARTHRFATRLAPRADKLARINRTSRPVPTADLFFRAKYPNHAVVDVPRTCFIAQPRRC
jgi:hypothetical protein